MTQQWIGYTAAESREELERALLQVNPHAHLVFARDAADIRCRLRDEEPRTVGAIVGLTTDGVSDVNLAAALASDQRASEVVLVARFVTGSLRSRAAQAGITRVIDIDDVLFDELPEVASNTKGASVTHVQEAEEGHDAQGPVMVFASGRGGVGKTALVATAAALAGHWGLRVAAVDLDLACGNLPSCYGVGRWVDPTSYMNDAELSRPDALDAGSSACEGVTLWGPCQRPELAEQAMPVSGALLQMLSKSFDLVLVDTSSTCTDAVAQAMQAADRLVLVHDDGPGSIAFLARTSALAVRLGVARTRIVRIENGCLPRKMSAPFSPLVEMGLENARAYRVPDGGDEIRELLAEGKADELRELGGDFVRGVATLLASLLQELGALPDNDDARRAANMPRRRRRQLFGHRKEVA